MVQRPISTVVFGKGEGFAATAPLLIIGAGAAGLCAALTAKEAGTDVVVVERDATPAGLNGAVGRPHSGRRHKISARQGYCGHPANVCRRYRAQGEGRS